MPLYEYSCSTCGAVYDQLVSISTSSMEIQCTQKDCHGRAKRQISVSAKPFVNDPTLVHARTHDGKK